jgi:hypothetical protein
MEKIPKFEIQTIWRCRLTHGLHQHILFLFNAQNVRLLNWFVKTSCWNSRSYVITNNSEIVVLCICEHVKWISMCFTWFHDSLLLVLPYDSPNVTYQWLDVINKKSKKKKKTHYAYAQKKNEKKWKKKKTWTLNINLKPRTWIYIKP